MCHVALRIAALAALASAWTLSQPAAAEDPKPAETQTVTSSEQSETLQVPASWKLEPMTVPETDGAWRVTAPGAATFNLLLKRQAVSRDEVLGTSAYAWREPRPGGGRFLTKPIPHVLLDVKGPGGSEWKGCFSVRVLRRRGYGLVLQAPKAAFDAVLPAFFDVVRSLQSTRGQLPDVPDDWKKVARDGYEYFLQPGRSEADVAPLHKFLSQQEAAFAKRYGAVPKPANNPIVVLLVQRLEDASAAGFDLKDKDGDVTWSVDGACVVVSAAVKDGFASNLGLAGAFCMALEQQTFGLSLPRWVSRGEAALRIFEAQSGYALPQYSESLTKGIPKSLMPLRDLAKTDERDETVSGSAMVYAAFLRTAPRPCSDKFSAYIKAIRSGSDPDAAFSDFLSAVDVNKLQADAGAFLASLKPVKAK